MALSFLQGDTQPENYSPGELRLSHSSSPAGGLWPTQRNLHRSFSFQFLIEIQQPQSSGATATQTHSNTAAPCTAGRAVVIHLFSRRASLLPTWNTTLKCNVVACCLKFLGSARLWSNPRQSCSNTMYAFLFEIFSIILKWNNLF